MGGAPDQDTAKYIEKLERKLKIAVAECHNYRQRMESALKLAETLESELEVFKRKHYEMRVRRADSPSDLAPMRWRVSERAVKYWTLVRNAVQVSSFLTQGILSNQIDEDTFMATLARHSRAKQKLLFREIFRLIKRYRTLLTISNTIANELQLDKSISNIVEATYEILGCDRVTMFIVDPIRQELECRVSKDSTGWRIPIGRGIAGECAATGDTYNIKDAYQVTFCLFFSAVFSCCVW